MDNILVYHLPFRQVDELSPICEFHSKKIRKRKVVGNIGSFQFSFNTYKRRFIIGDKDYLSILLKEEIKVTQPNLRIEPNTNFYEDNTDPFGTDGIDQEVPF